MESDCIRIWLKVSEDERANRVTNREGISLEEAKTANAKRLMVDNERYQKCTI